MNYLKHKMLFFCSIACIVSAGTLHAQSAIRFQSMGDYISIPHSISLAPKNFTIELWFRVTGINTSHEGGEQTILDKRDGNTKGGYNLRLAGKQFPLGIFMVSDNHVVGTNNIIESQTWYHIAVTRDDSTTRIYLDGHLCDIQTHAYISETNSELRIGEFIWYPGAYLGLHGDLDEIRIWNKVKSENEIYDEMNKDLVGNELNLVGYWNFEQDSYSIIKDHSQENNDGSLHGDCLIIDSNAPIGFIPPKPPKGFHAINTNNGLELKWKKTENKNILLYKLFRGSSQNFSLDEDSQIALIDSSFDSYIDTSAQILQDYYYRIISSSSEYESDPSMSSFGRKIEILNDYDVGVYYYPWYGESYHNWNTGEGTLRRNLIPPHSPALGNYESDDLNVIVQHLDWMENYGIDFIVSSWWGDVYPREDYVLKNFIVPELVGRPIRFTIYYELLKDGGVIDGKIYIDSERENIMVNDFVYLANTYFDHPNFLKVDGKPVVFLYVSAMLSGNYLNVFSRIRSELDQLGYGLFLVGDEMVWGNPDQSHMQFLDAISPYTLIAPWGANNQGAYPLDSDFFGTVSNLNFNWEKAAENIKIKFIPNISPGCNNTSTQQTTNMVVPRYFSKGGENCSTYSEYIKSILSFIDPGLKMLMITSWNEWHEDSQIEPTTEAPITSSDNSASGVYYTQGYNYEGYGLKYLEITREILAKDKSTTVDGRGMSIDHFNLSQNFPNPFNLSTTINYSVLTPSKVVVSVFSITGQLVEEIELGLKSVGLHSLVWNADNLASGVYIYKVQVGNVSKLKKCIFIK